MVVTTNGDISTLEATLLGAGIPIAVTLVTWFTKILIDHKLDPLVTKIQEHDGDIKEIKDTASVGAASATATNIAVARIEGYLAGTGRQQLPDTPASVQIEQDAANANT